MLSIKAEVRGVKNNKQRGHKVGQLGPVGFCWRCQGKVKGHGDDHDSSLPKTLDPETGKPVYSAKCSRRGIYGEHRKALLHQQRKFRRALSKSKKAYKGEMGSGGFRSGPVAGIHKRNASSKKGKGQ